ncbi:hypothetical protein VSX61_15715, partial [Brenneria populi subsp. brevivirga]|uniref:hypothetical protein n=1 Tax=Brenneria populi TaxID=1505588 RepID=UPI002E170B1A|nr:hypothetical protein [Brenneria populi subsp. brevivirga]
VNMGWRKCSGIRRSYLVRQPQSEDKCDYFIILDQDSILRDGYFEQMAAAEGYDLIVPKIFLERDRHLYQTHPHREEDAIFTIARHGIIDEKFHTCMSGASLSLPFINNLLGTRNNIFDERLGLYYADTEFFIYINKLIDNGMTISRYCAGEIVHDSYQMNGIFDQSFKKSNPRFAELQIVNLYKELYIDHKSKASLYKKSCRALLNVRNISARTMSAAG